MTDAKTLPNSGPKKVHNWQVRVDRQLCIGAATCVAIAAKTFALDKEAKAVILDSSDKETKENFWVLSLYNFSDDRVVKEIVKIKKSKVKI